MSIGSSPDLVVAAGSAMAIGALAGIVPALGFLYLGPLLEEKIRLHGTCGVHNLHGRPDCQHGSFDACQTKVQVISVTLAMITSKGA